MASIKNLVSTFALGLLTMAATHAQVPNKPVVKPGIKVRNTSPFARKDVNVVVNRYQLKRLIGNWQAELRPLVVVNDKFIPSQVDDIDQNGQWDELAFQLDLAAEETAVVTIKWMKPEALPKFTQKTQARLGVSEKRDDVFTSVKSEIKPDDWKAQTYPTRYQLEGPGWENDRIAFRSYFDERNGKDIFTKVKPDLVIDKIGIPKTELGDYHKLASWGMDILKVGESLGAGAIALQEGDSLYPIGNSQKLTYTLVSQGPVRSIVKLENKGWQVPGQPVNSTELITIWAGKFWYENAVTLSGFNEAKTLITGVTYVKHPKPEALKSGDKSALPWVATHAVQSENNDILGMACLFPQEQFTGFGDATKTTKRVKTTYYGKLKVAPNQTIRYYFMAGWPLSDARFSEQAGWLKFVQQEADEISQKPQILPL